METSKRVIYVSPFQAKGKIRCLECGLFLFNIIDYFDGDIEIKCRRCKILVNVISLKSGVEYLAWDR